MSKWTEVRCDFFNEIEQAWFIDAWEDGEEGTVIAKIFNNGNVEYLDDDARTDSYAQEIIRNVLADIKENF